MPPPTSGPVYIGIDVGTSSVKAIMGSVAGGQLDSYAGRHETARRTRGAAEQDPAAWMQHVDAALARFAAHPRAGDVVAIGVTSQVNTHVFCDARLAPLHPAITWQDTRPAAAASRLDAAISPEEKTGALGAPIPIDASHALARMAWMAETHPDAWAATTQVMLPKDYVIARLTGQSVADPISAVGLAGADLQYAPAILDLLAGADTLLPTLRDPLDIAGQMRSDGPFAGVPVATGTMDAWAGMFGLGVASEGEAFYLSGTSDVLGLISSDRPGEAGIITFPEWRGITLHAGPTQSGGASLAWLARLLGHDVATLGQLAAEARITRQSPLFLPHLEGERAPLWDANSRGAFAGMTSSIGPEVLAACVMEGVAFSARLALEAIERSGNRAVDRLRHGGGGAASDTWCQIRANALGRTLERVKVSEAGAMGALVIAATSTGEVDDLGKATTGLVAIERTFRPDPDQAALAEDRFEAYKQLYAALGPVNATVQALR